MKSFKSYIKEVYEETAKEKAHRLATDAHSKSRKGMKKATSDADMVRQMNRTQAASKTMKRTAEEVEELDELSKKTLGSYIKKASDNKAVSAHAMSHKEPDAVNKFVKRHHGINKAVDKLTKEENIQELSSKTKDAYRNKATKDVSDRIASSATKKAQAAELKNKRSVRMGTPAGVEPNAKALKLNKSAAADDRKAQNRFTGIRRSIK